MTRPDLHMITIPLLAAIVFVSGCTKPEAEPARATGRELDSRAAVLQQIVSDVKETNRIPGLVVAVARSGEEPLVATAGVADRERGIAVSPDTMFFTGSISKNLFATVALRMVDQGRLTLDTPLATYVDWPRGDETTLRMLLDHTAGIPEYLTRDRFAKADDGGIPVFFRTPHRPADLLADLPDRAPRFDPGTAQDYSNTNGLLVGEMIRLASGRPLGTVFDEEIVRPLKLKHMYLYGEATRGRDRARGYCQGEAWGAGEDEAVDCSAADDALVDSADGSVVASALDLLRYHEALRSGELLTDESWIAMRKGDGKVDNGLGYLVGEGPFGHYEGNVGRAIGHVAACVYYADHDTYVVMMSNLGTAPLPLRPFLERWFGEAETPRN